MSMAIKIGGMAFKRKKPSRAALKNQLARTTGLSLAQVDAVFAAVADALPVRLASLQDELTKGSGGVEPRDPMMKWLAGFDLLGVYNGIRDREAVTSLSMETLRRMARQTPPVSAIIQTRCNQVAAFAQRPESRVDSGYKVRMRDTQAKPTAADKNRIKELELAIEACGLVEPDPVLGEHRFDAFLRMLTRDSLTLDAMCFEVRPGKNPDKYPALRWQAVDAAQIRKVEPHVYRQEGLVQGADKPVLYVQYRLGKVEAEFTSAELAYGIRNPATDMTTLGYGISELEMLIDIVSSMLFALNYNKTYFTQSSVPPGILSITGNVSAETLEAFRRQWEAQVKGVGNHWNTPVMWTKDGQGLNYVPFRQSSRDMEYHQWLSYLTTITAAVYAVHPEEIGFQSWSAMNRAPMSESSPVSRLKHSEDKGLVPFLKRIAALINEHIVWAIDPNFEFAWQNITEFDETADMQFRQQRVSFFSSVDQEREEMDLEPYNEEWSKIPLNPIIAQMIGQKQQMDMMGGGAPPDESDDDEDMQGALAGGDESLPQTQQQMAYQQMQGRGAPGGSFTSQGKPNMASANAQGMPPMNKSLGAKELKIKLGSLGVPEDIVKSLALEGIHTLQDLGNVSAWDVHGILGVDATLKLARALGQKRFDMSAGNGTNGRFTITKRGE